MATSGCNNEGDAEHQSVEAMWDALLTQGRDIYAIACDDTHRYERFAAEEDTPGLGWIVARVKELTQEEVLSAIANGDFYASTGVELQDVVFDGHKLTVSIKPEAGKSYRIRFIGCGGKVESEVDETGGTCRVSDAPGAYIRAKIIASDGGLAWTQAYRKA